MSKSMAVIVTLDLNKLGCCFKNLKKYEYANKDFLFYLCIFTTPNLHIYAYSGHKEAEMCLNEL